MNRVVIGALAALLLVAAGVFWWQGRATPAADLPAPRLAEPDPRASGAAEDDTPPDSDASDAVGPDLPEVPEQTREEKRFDRLDRDHDGKISRAEMLAARVKEFRKLDVDGNNLLTFEEWATATSNKFKGADANGDGVLDRGEYATTKAKPKKPACKCR